MQFEPAFGVGVEMGALLAVMRGVGVGVGVAFWLGIATTGIVVGVGACRRPLWFSESLTISLDDEERGEIPAPHAASKTIKQRHSSPQPVFFTNKNPS